MTANDVYRRCTLGYRSTSIGASKGKRCRDRHGPEVTYVMWSLGEKIFRAVGGSAGGSAGDSTLLISQH